MIEYNTVYNIYIMDVSISFGDTVIVQTMFTGDNGKSLGVMLDETLSMDRQIASVRGCPHYASRRRASRRGPSGVVCLDTWAMRRDYSRLQA